MIKYEQSLLLVDIYPHAASKLEIRPSGTRLFIPHPRNVTLVEHDQIGVMAQAKRRKGNSGDQGSVSDEETRSTPLRDEGTQSQISDRELRAGASQPDSSGRYQGSSGRTREDEDLTTISKQADDSDNGLESLHNEEISGSAEEDIRTVNLSDTDEDENEGLGDGNLGRSVRRGLDE